MNGWIRHWEIQLSQWHFVHQKSHMNWPGIEPGPAWCCLKLNGWHVWAGWQVCLVGSEGLTLLWCILDVSGLDTRSEDVSCVWITGYNKRNCTNCFIYKVLANRCSYYQYTTDNQYSRYCLFVYFWHNSPQRARASSFTRFLDHTQRHTTDGRTPLDKWSARRGYLYLTTHNTHNRQKSMPPVGFEPTISAGKRPQTYASTQ
jgi:hypothetical protein